MLVSFVNVGIVKVEVPVESIRSRSVRPVEIMTVSLRVESAEVP